jgi:Domain of unknown function (DUF1963)
MMPDMDTHYLQVWREQAREHGIPEPDIDQWLGLARPLLWLHKVQDDPAAANAPVVGYRGGHPSLPLDVEWPGGPDFVASVDCAALPSDLRGFPLPEDGHLLFFHNTEYMGPECDSPDDDGRVLYVPAGTATAERVINTGRHLKAEPERIPLQCSSCWDPPHDCCGPMPDGFGQLTQHLEDPRPAYLRNGADDAMLLGGYCTTWTVDRCELAEYTDPEHKKWRRLAFMPRDLIMDEEALPFLVHWIIREDDLAGKRFDRVKTYAEDLFA